MRSFFIRTCATALLTLLACSSAVGSQSNESRLRDLESKDASTTIAIAQAEKMEAFLQTDGGIALFLSGQPFVVDKKALENWLTAQILTSQMTPTDAANFTRELTSRRSEALTSIQKVLSRLRDEQWATRLEIKNLRAEIARAGSGPAEWKGSGCHGFDGSWDTDSGPLIVSGSHGNYVFNNVHSTVDGTVNGRSFSGNWAQPNYPTERYTNGRFEWTLSEDGREFHGKWWDKYGTLSGSWNGRCVSK